MTTPTSCRSATTRITFITGDAKRLDQALPAALLTTCQRPFLVIEDSSHMYAETAAVLEYFHPVLQRDDYVVIEDGIVAQLSGDHYRSYQNGPNRALADFLAVRGDDYDIDTDLCDRFGHNTTYNPNGWLRRL